MSCYIKMECCHYIEEDKRSEEQAKERSYYDMTGSDNIYKYMTDEVKRVGSKRNLRWVGNQTGVFNRDGVLTFEDIDKMKLRLKNNKGNIYYGFISLPKETCKCISTPQKCIELLKYTFIDFCRDAKFYYKDLDLMCCLHSEMKDHIHMHFVFWEKEPKYYKAKGQEDKLEYRFKPIPKRAKERLALRVEYFASKERSKVKRTKEDSYIKLGKMLNFFLSPIRDDTYIKQEMLALSRKLPEELDRLYYNSKELDPEIKKAVDKIKAHLFMYDKKARKADLNFYDALEEMQEAYSEGYLREDVEAVSEETIKRYNDDIGNKILGVCKFMKEHEYDRKGKTRNDNVYKTMKAIHRTSSDKIFHKFMENFSRETASVSQISQDILEEKQESIRKEGLYKGGK